MFSGIIFVFLLLLFSVWTGILNLDSGLRLSIFQCFLSLHDVICPKYRFISYHFSNYNSAKFYVTHDKI